METEERHTTETIAKAVAVLQDKENKRDVTTRSQTKLLDAEDRVKTTQLEIADLANRLRKTREVIEELKELEAAQSLNLADLQADERADLQLIHQLRMDGVSLP